MKQRLFLMLTVLPACSVAQEASVGFSLPITVTGGAFSYEGEREAGFRTVAYPTLKLGRHWFLGGAIQASSRPYFYEQFDTQGRGLKGDLLQGYAGYSHTSGNKSVVVKTGVLSSAFGSFLLRYDDAVNPLIDMPQAYGYYYKQVTTLGLPGAQVDFSAGKLDTRIQFTNSSPANRRSLFDHAQYPNWAGGAGYTVRQGLRLGTSFYRGPYLHREHRFFRRGEERPRDLPGAGYGLDLQFARGHWYVNAELQRFQLAYKIVPTFSMLAGYGELKYVFHPRWYVATRVGHRQSNRSPERDVFEFAVGFRPNRVQLVKVGYQMPRGPGVETREDSILGIQLVTTWGGPTLVFR